MKALILRLDAPMMSFGTVIVDHHGYIDRFPGTAMLCGLIANALGWEHGEFERLQELQNRIEFGARWDVQPERMVDYHTVDLGQPKMRDHGWTIRGKPEHRGGASHVKRGTHQRYRHYWTDGLITVAIALKSDAAPDLDAVRRAICRPVRPLFIGRKTCLPSRPLLDPKMPVVEGEDILDILRQVPAWDRHGNTRLYDALVACWPTGLEADGRAMIRRVFDLRDWANGIPVGSRWQTEGVIRSENQ